MRKTTVVLTMLVACFVFIDTSAADDAAPKKKPAKSKWVQAMALLGVLSPFASPEARQGLSYRIEGILSSPEQTEEESLE